MNTIAIIGVGQIGSRHLQGLALSKVPLQIYCVDPLSQSLAIARERWEEVKSNDHQVTFLDDYNKLPFSIDIVIVASNSIIRRSIIEQLLHDRKIKYFILEKILFSNLDDYLFVDNLLQESNSKAWVNCARRMFTSYQKIFENLKAEIKVNFSVTGNNWGLGSNGIHFLDFFAYITRDTNFEILTNGLDEKCHKSKRPGYYEISGTIAGFNDRGDSFTITSFDTEKHSPITINISTPNYRYHIEEGIETRFSRLDQKFEWETENHSINYQSTLTNIIVEELILKGSCSLTPFSESSIIHQKFLKPILDFGNLRLGWNTDQCPLT